MGATMSGNVAISSGVIHLCSEMDSTSALVNPLVSTAMCSAQTTKMAELSKTSPPVRSDAPARRRQLVLRTLPEQYLGLIEMAPFVNWSRIEIGLRSIVALSFYK
jgi:hypothetical protein